MHVENITADMSEIHYHGKRTIRNPLPKQCKQSDFYERENGWQRRYVTWIEDGWCEYAAYSIEHYRINQATGGIEGGKWEYLDRGSCTLAHIRSWSQK